MAEYQVTISRFAAKEFAELPPSVIERVRRKILQLSSNPRPTGCRKLEGHRGWRIRVGDWRILYEIDDRHHIVDIGAIRHRSKAYD